MASILMRLTNSFSLLRPDGEHPAYPLAASLRRKAASCGRSGWALQQPRGRRGELFALSAKTSGPPNLSGLISETAETISGTVSDEHGVQRVEVYDNGADLGAATLDGKGG